MNATVSFQENTVCNELPNELFNLDFSVVRSYAIFMSPVIETLFYMYFVHNQSLLSDSVLKVKKTLSRISVALFFKQGEF